MSDLQQWINEAVLALDAATKIGQRSCNLGDHLNYANHDRLIASAPVGTGGHIRAAMWEVMEISERVDQASNRVVSKMEARRIVAAALTQGDAK